MDYFLGIPELRLSEKEKYENDHYWFKKVMEFHLPSGGMTNYLTEAQQKMVNNYLYRNDKFDFGEWEDVCNELGIDETNFDTTFFKVNIINVIVNYLKTVELRRNDTYTPLLLTQQAMVEKDEQLKNQIAQYVEGQLLAVLQSNQKYQELIMAAQDQSGQIAPEQLAEIEKQVQAMEQELKAQYPIPQIEGFMSELEILANKIIQYATYNTSVRYKKVKNDCFEDVILNDGEIVRIVDTYDGTEFERVNLPYFLCHKSPEHEYVQQSMWAAYTKMFTLFQLKLEFPELENDELARYGLYSHNIESPTIDIRTHHHTKYPEWDTQALITKGLPYYDEKQQYGYGELPYVHRERLIPVTHFEFVAFKKIGFLRTTDIMGKEILEFVDESFDTPKSAVKEKAMNEWGYESDTYFWEGGSVEWLWLPRKYEMYRIGLNFYTRIREVKNQPINPDNPFKHELSYYGKFLSNYNAERISVFERLKPYNVLYVVIFNKLAQLAERWDGYLIPVDPSAIPSGLGDTSEERMNKFFQYRKEGYLIQDSFVEDKPGLTRPAPAVIPVDIGQTFAVLMQMLNWIKSEMGLIVGVSPQALSQMISGNVTDNQQALRQTSYMIDPTFQQHNWIWQEIMTGYVNHFIEWAKNKIENGGEHRLSYIFGENQREVLRIKPENLEFAYLGVMINNSNPKEYFDIMLRESQAMIQNQMLTVADFSKLLLAVQSGESPYEIQKYFIKAQKDRETRDAQIQEQQMKVEQMKQASQKEMIQIQKDLINLQEQWKEKHIEAKGEIDKEIANIKVYQNQETLDVDNNGISDALQAGELQRKINEGETKLNIEKQKAITEARSQSFEEVKEKNKQIENQKDREHDLQKERIKANKSTNKK